MQNKMAEVANLLGVELEEEFIIDGEYGKYKLSKNGLKYWSDISEQWFTACWLEELLIGGKKIIKIPKTILDDKEKEYLSNVIKPFRDKVKYITKNRKDNLEFEYISISYHDNGGECALNFPDFRTGTMYRNMIISSPYKLEELGL